MEDIEKIESEIKELFGIVEEAAPAATTEADAATSAPTVTNTNTESEQSLDSSSTDSATDSVQTQESTETTETVTENPAFNPEDKFINKQNSAFAQMRIQNKGMSDLIMDLAKATGQQPKDIAEAQALLRNNLTTIISKNRNIPEDVLREMDANKQALAELQAAQARQKALAGFQAVKDQHTLSKEEVNAFADKLIENNINPFEQDIDLLKEYRHMYFDALIAKAKEAGVQEERARSMNAQQNSTAPDTTRSLPENTGSREAIKTVKDLNAFLDSLV